MICRGRGKRAEMELEMNSLVALPCIVYLSQGAHHTRVGVNDDFLRRHLTRQTSRDEIECRDAQSSVERR